jgi:hypothetical protein
MAAHNGIDDDKVPHYKLFGSPLRPRISDSGVGYLRDRAKLDMKRAIPSSMVVFNSQVTLA